MDNPLFMMYIVSNFILALLTKADLSKVTNIDDKGTDYLRSGCIVLNGIQMFMCNII